MITGLVLAGISFLAARYARWWGLGLLFFGGLWVMYTNDWNPQWIGPLVGPGAAYVMFGRKDRARRDLAPMKPFAKEFERALREENAAPKSADGRIRIVRAAIRVAESTLDDAVPDLKRAEAKSPGPIAIGNAFEVMEQRSAAVARHRAAMKAMGEVARRAGLSGDARRRLYQEVLEERMLHAAREDARVDDSNRPFDDRLLSAAQARAVSLQQLARAAAANETLGVPELPATARANAAINVARRLEDQILE